MDVTMIIVILCFILVLKWLVSPCGPCLDHLPRLKGWPIIGHLLQVDLNRPELTYQKWCRKLGDVFAVKLLNTNVVICNSYAAIYEVLVVKGAVFTGRPKIYRIQEYTHNYQDIGFSDLSLRSKLLRKIIQRELKVFDAGIKRLDDISNKCVASMISKFHEYKGRPFNPKEAVGITVMNITTSFLIKKTYNVDDEEFKLGTELALLTMSILNPNGKGILLDIFPFLKYFGNKCYEELKRSHEVTDRLWNLMKEQALESMKGGEDADGIVQTLMLHYKEQQNKGCEQGQKLEMVHLKLAFKNLIVGGMATSTSMFCAFLNTISQYPEVQRKLQQEVDEVVGPDRAVSLNDRPHMPYTLATLLEMLRFAMVVPLGFPRITMQDTTVQGHHIPAGVMIMTNLWALHFDDTFWDSPYEFQPERFLDTDGQVVSASHENRKHLLSFGAGPRVCIGERLAQGRLFLFIATIAQMFDVKQGSVKVSCDPRLLRPGGARTPPDFEIVAQSRNDILYG